ncbi:MAG: C-GCAxxG-C-C family protein [Sphaerochaetaceae bacterium]|nr:C-GCAxxG-C-C family protein [Sphaerochaetaceae bacterium]MDC7236607.1 C-GCAxxG-C-C family protein [Sphaerochaetaceae bacterium]MDC7242506.1 C-GCAxxG-C-C family protein [Sphaerochaetaceae bacterium]MDC7250250.1 C-GCAxxG-C-C family protein [Sphaerochaetaceae bacterium]
MDIKELKSKANDLHSKNYNCAQSVAGAFSHLVDIDEANLFKVCEGFGGGMGDHKECCGAVTGGIVILSLLNSSGTNETLTKAETYNLSADLRNQFIEKYDLTTCEVLKSISTEDDSNICDNYITDSVEMVCKIIEREGLLK